MELKIKGRLPMELKGRMKRTIYIIFYISVCFFIGSLVFAGGGKEKEITKEEIKLLWWNWGEEELPGWNKFSEETAKLYMEAHPNVTIEIVPQTQANLYEAFGAALAAKEGADIQNGWDGIWSMMWLWEGGMEPISDYLTKKEMDKIILKENFMAEGKLWAMPLYLVSTLFIYNKDVFKKVGLDPEKPPSTWDEFLAACEKIKKAGYAPIQAGNLEGIVSVDYSSYFLDQNANKRTDFMKVFVDPNEDYSSPKYSDGWYKFRELIEKGYFNEDVNSTRYYQAWERFLNGESAMVSLMSGWTRKVIETLGEENVGIFPYFPVSGSGKFSKKFVGGAQDLWITPWSKHKKEAADFIKYLVSTERSKAMYQLAHAIPANTEFDDSILETKLEKFIFNNIKKNYKPMYSGFVPGLIVEQGLGALGQEVFIQDTSVEELIGKFNALIPQVQTVTPAGFEGYKKWYEDYLKIGE